MPSDSKSAFISVVVPLLAGDDLGELERFLEAAHSAITGFSDFEFIIVDNCSGVPVLDINLPEAIRKNCYVMRLARPTSYDIATLAGFERANGDYAVNMHVGMAPLVGQIEKMYETTQSGCDVVYLRSPATSIFDRFSRRLYARLLGMFGSVKIDPMATRAFMVSRRALNWVLRNKSRTQFLNLVFLNSGYASQSLDVGKQDKLRLRSSRDNLRIAWNTLTSMTSFPLAIGEMAVLLMTAGCALASLNALLVRFLQINILGQPEEQVPGWAFTVILISGGFALTNLSIYAVLRMLNILLEDGKSEARYVVESFRRV